MKISDSAPLALAVCGISVLSIVATGYAQAPPSPEQVVATVKQNLAESQKRLRQYDWVETTVVSLKGEEKSRQQQRVYYGADGKLTKLPIGEQPDAKGGGGGPLKRRAVENKKDDMKDYMERAVALIQKYVPPDPTEIQKAKDASKMAVRPQGQGKVRVEFQNFLQPSDLLSIDLDTAAGRLGGISVATYLEKPEDTVTLNVKHGALTDGTSYTATTTLDAKAKDIRVVITNSGHRPLPK